MGRAVTVTGNQFVPTFRITHSALKRLHASVSSAKKRAIVGYCSGVSAYVNGQQTVVLGDVIDTQVRETRLLAFLNAELETCTLSVGVCLSRNNEAGIPLPPATNGEFPFP